MGAWSSKQILPAFSVQDVHSNVIINADLKYGQYWKWVLKAWFSYVNQLKHQCPQQQKQRQKQQQQCGTTGCSFTREVVWSSSLLLLVCLQKLKLWAAECPRPAFRYSGSYKHAQAHSAMLLSLNTMYANPQCRAAHLQCPITSLSFSVTLMKGSIPLLHACSSLF